MISPKSPREEIPSPTPRPAVGPGSLASPLPPQDLDLDPEDWEAFRKLAHRALDAMLDFQQGARDKPVWRPMPAETERLFQEDAPRRGLGTDAVVEDMLSHVAPYPSGNFHPRFWGWVCGTGTPTGMLAEMIAAGVNSTSGTFNDAGSRVEDQVVRWMKDLFDFPGTASGLITSGGSVANLVGLAVARDQILAHDIPRWGLAAHGGQPVLYASTETHSSVIKAIQTLGLGRDALRSIPVDAEYQMRLDVLSEQIRKDRCSGLSPFAVVGNAGSVNTGSIDDLEGIAGIARREGLWFHVDGAIGGLARLAPGLASRFQGIEMADSIAFDFHKWLYVPYEAGCVLIRDGEAHRSSFAVAASYLEPPARGIAALPDSTNQRGPQLSRGFKALKVWAQIREHGLDRLGRQMQQNVDHIRYAASQIEAQPELELCAPVALNIACFRYRPTRSPESTWNAINGEILMRLQEQGIAAPSSTRLQGQFVLRIANTNQRSQRRDFDLLIRETVRLGRELEGLGETV
ncbi:MAG: pyridoxal-dependent decarboxylase [Acidobacteriota bacterium]